MLEVHLARGAEDGRTTSHREVYRVPIPDGEQWTAMDVLDFIQRRIDGSVAYFKHCACNQGVCRSCAARINGRIGLLCTHLIRDEAVLLLEPLSDDRRVRDLACR
jgi:succinate dehydrogenase/fumarate reductase-like Fe-S protein